MTQNTPYPPPAPAAPPPSSPQGPVVYYPLPPGWGAPRKGFIRRMFRTLFVLLFILSVLGNFYLSMLLAASVSGMAKTVIEEGDAKQVVAVYTVSGMIAQKAAAGFERFYQTVRDDNTIRAVVVRVESTGGTVSASDQIHQMVLSIRQDLKRKVVVSMGGWATSGGYYIAAPAEEIFAEPTTLTGSIGVIATWPVVKGLLDKVGIEPVVIRSTHTEAWKAREFSPLESPDPTVRKGMQALLDVWQDRFEKVVMDGRGDKLAKPGALAASPATTQPAQPDPFNGRAYAALEAKRLGLVDEIGYLRDAARAAAKLADLKSPRIVEFSRRAGLMESLLGADASRGGEGGLRMDADLLDSLAAPRILMVWRPE